MDDVVQRRQPRGLPEIRIVGLADIRASLAEGASDFARRPGFGLAIGGIFALTGMVIALALTVWHMPWMIYPFAIGFPLIGPFAAVGLYEVSRGWRPGRRPIGGAVLSVVWAQRRREVSWMAFVDAVRVLDLDVPGPAADRPDPRPHVLRDAGSLLRASC